MANLCVAVVCFITTAITGSLFGLKRYDKKNWQKIEESTMMFIGKVIMTEPQGSGNSMFHMDGSNIPQEKVFMGKLAAKQLPEDGTSKKNKKMFPQFHTSNIKDTTPAVGARDAPGDGVLEEKASLEQKMPHEETPIDEHASTQSKAFDIEGFEALKMTVPPMFQKYPIRDDRFNGRFVPVGKSSDGRPIFQQQGGPTFMGRERTIAWFKGHWRYYSFYDFTSKAGSSEKCTFMVKSDAKHPLDIPEALFWTVHPSAKRWVKARGFGALFNLKVHVHDVP